MRFNTVSGALMRIGRLLTVALPLIVMPLSATDAQEADLAKAAKVKAAFLYNFIKFVEWPDRSPSTTKKATICIAGSHPFSNALDTLKSQLAGKIDLSIIINADNAAIAQCHILFIGENTNGGMSGLLSEARKADVLTVSESNGFADKGGIIEMKTVEKSIGLFSSNKINLRINLNAAEVSSLRINAQLLEIAAEVIK